MTPAKDASSNNNNNNSNPPPPPPAPAGNEEPEPTPAESDMTEAIARDRPTIDSAVKSYISMVCARSMAASPTDASATKSRHDKLVMGIIPGLAKTSISSSSSGEDTAGAASANGDDSDNDKSSNTKTNTTTSSASVQQQVLQLARLVLKAVNSYTFPVHDTVAYSMAEKPGTTPEQKEKLLEISVVSRLWNALVQSEQKPSRFLGRRALRLAWKNLDVAASLETTADSASVSASESSSESSSETASPLERQREWLRQFEVLLFAPATTPLPPDGSVDENENDDDDAALLWAPDGGAAELAKRRQRRLDAARERGPRTPS